MEVGAIIVSPTRELAIQISEILEEFLKRIPLLKQVLLVGGVTLQKDAEKLKKGANIIVATPGRLKDILSNYINLGLYIKSLVRILFSCYNVIYMAQSPELLTRYTLILSGISCIR